MYFYLLLEEMSVVTDWMLYTLDCRMLLEIYMDCTGHNVLLANQWLYMLLKSDIQMEIKNAGM